MMAMMMVAVMALFRLVAKETRYSKDYQAQNYPYAIEHCRGLEHIEDGGPQLREWRTVVDDGINIQAYGYQETDEQRKQLGANAMRGNVEVWHYLS